MFQINSPSSCFSCFQFCSLTDLLETWCVRVCLKPTLDQVSLCASHRLNVALWPAGLLRDPGDPPTPTLPLTSHFSVSTLLSFFLILLWSSCNLACPLLCKACWPAPLHDLSSAPPRSAEKHSSATQIHISSVRSGRQLRQIEHGSAVGAGECFSSCCSVIPGLWAADSFVFFCFYIR